MNRPREGEDWLPPGQTATRRFPLVGEPTPPARSVAPRGWSLEVSGLVERASTFDLAAIRSMPATNLSPDLHCVTGWSRRATSFTGLRLATLLGKVGVLPGAAFVRFEALSQRGHDTSLSLDAAMRETWLVYAMDGEPLPPAHGGPLRSLTPTRYLYKSVKWLRRIELLERDRPGYWEREAGYDNEADPWRERRFVTGDLKPADVERFRHARRYAPFRGRNLLGVDLRGWAPTDLDLRELQIRAGDLRESSLRGADLRGANLSSSDLRGADLRDADLRGADIEGADLRGADLRGADLRGARLTAVRLADPRTRVDGLRWGRDGGLLEQDERFLRGAGVGPSDSA